MSKLVNLSFSCTRTQRVLKLLESEIAAYHNWIASAIESGEDDYAKWLVAEMREAQEIASRIRGCYNEQTGMYPDADKANKPKWYEEATGKKLKRNQEAVKPT